MKKTAANLLGLSALLLAASVTLHVRRAGRFPVSGKVVLITGASRGLGLALAESFARAGAFVVLVARSDEELDRARALLIKRGATQADRLLAIPCDIRNKAQVNKLLATVANTWSPVEVLINNAGVITVGPLASQTTASFEDAMQTNFFGMVYASLAVLPPMRVQGEGSIVNITSIGGKVAVPHMLPYTASKFACVGFSQGLHAEVASDGIRVTTVTPGLLRTGSPLRAQFTGRRAEEYRWFNLGASLPGVSRNVYRAAQRILQATEAGEIELSITPQAAIAARVAGSFPGLTTRMLRFVNDLVLPDDDLHATEPLLGEDHQERDFRMLTGAGRLAAQHWNQS